MKKEGKTNREKQHKRKQKGKGKKPNIGRGIEGESKRLEKEKEIK